MKHYIARTALAALSIATLYMNLAPAAQADEACSTAKAAGDWGGTLTGTLILPTGPVSGAAVGRLTADREGNISGTEARNVGGDFANETLGGFWAVNSDCTGTFTANIYESGKLIRTSVLSIVFVDELREARLVQQSLTLPDGTTVPVVITVDPSRVIGPSIGPDRLTESEARRKGAELIQKLGIDTEEYFHKVTSPLQTFRQKAQWTRENDPAFLEGQPGAVKQMESALRVHILPALGDLPLEKVDEQRVQEFVTKLKTTVLERKNKGGRVMKRYKLSRSTVCNIIKVVKRVVGKKVWISWDLKLGRPQEFVQRYFTEAEMLLIIEAAEGMWKVFFSVLAATGMRVGENCGLYVNDLDLVNQVIHVRRSFSEISSSMLPTKSKKGYRDIDTDASLSNLLGDYLAGRKTGLLFQSRRGTPLRPGNVLKRQLHPILKMLGIPLGGKLTHAFRHGRVTLLRKREIPSDLQQLWIGHSTLEMTGRYSHTDQELEYRRSYAVQAGMKLIQ